MTMYLTLTEWHEHATGVWHEPGEQADLSHIGDLDKLILARTVEVVPDNSAPTQALFSIPIADPSHDLGDDAPDNTNGEAN